MTVIGTYPRGLLKRSQHGDESWRLTLNNHKSIEIVMLQNIPFFRRKGSRVAPEHQYGKQEEDPDSDDDKDNIYKSDFALSSSDMNDEYSITQKVQNWWRRNITIEMMKRNSRWFLDTASVDIKISVLHAMLTKLNYS